VLCFLLFFFVSVVRFEGKTVSFCVQSFDGPCPLLAMANVLLLRNKLRIKTGFSLSLRLLLLFVLVHAPFRFGSSYNKACAHVGGRRDCVATGEAEHS
jgi:hypothetical protein